MYVERGAVGAGEIELGRGHVSPNKIHCKDKIMSQGIQRELMWKLVELTVAVFFLKFLLRFIQPTTEELLYGTAFNQYLCLS